MGLFKPSGKQIAVEVYNRSPKLAAHMAAETGRSYPKLEPYLQNPSVAMVLSDVAAECLFRGVAIKRSPEVAQKATFFYLSLPDTSFSRLMEEGLQATRAGRSQEFAIAKLLAEASGVLNAEDWEAFAIAYRRNVADAVIAAL